MRLFYVDLLCSVLLCPIMGPMPHLITPDLSLMTYVGEKPDHPLSLKPVDLKSVCESCGLPIVCRDFPRGPWYHAAPGELLEQSQEATE